MVPYFSMPKSKKRTVAAVEFSPHDVLSIVKDASVSQIQKVIGLLDEVKEARHRLENLFSGGLKAAQAYAPRTGTAAPKKSRSGRPGKGSVAKASPKKGDELVEPRKGSLRALVHAVLKDKGPIKTNDVVKILTAKLGKKGGPSLRVRINQVLINKRDPFIKKIERGVYSYQG
jgi:hypothetical protein